MENRESVEILKSIDTIDQVLTAIAEIPSKNYPNPMADEFKKRLGEMLWPALPGHVAQVNLGEEASISRNPDDLRFIPEAQRETWDLARVDKLGADQSRAMQLEWKPKF